MEIVFYKSKEHPGFYLLYKGMNGHKPQEHIKRLTHTDGFENSGYPKIEIEIGFVIKTDAPDSFFEYLVEEVATNHIPVSKYDEGKYRAWYEFKNITEADKWLADYHSYQQVKKINNPSTVQAILF